MAQHNNSKKEEGMSVLEIGAGLAAVAVAAGAAGYYFYGSKDASKHRKSTAKWASDLQKIVVKNAKKLKDINADTIAKVVDDATAAYQGVRGVDPAEVRQAAMELKENWFHIQKELAGRSGATKKKSAKKVAKKKS